MKKLYWDIWRPFWPEYLFSSFWYILFLWLGSWLCLILAASPWFLQLSRKKKIDGYFSCIKRRRNFLLYQHRRAPPMGGCRKSLHAFTRTARNTISLLPEGHYLTITHDTALRRLKNSPEIEITCITAAYKANLLPEMSRIVGNRCARCQHLNTCRYTEKEVRQFYEVKFIKKKGVIEK